MQPAYRHGQRWNQNRQTVDVGKHAFVTLRNDSSDNFNCREPKEDEGVHEDKHPTFHPAGSSAEYGMLFQHVQIPIHCVTLPFIEIRFTGSDPSSLISTRECHGHHFRTSHVLRQGPSMSASIRNLENSASFRAERRNDYLSQTMVCGSDHRTLT